jgi:hypothetical protein
MLRLLSAICATIAAISALISPVVILHWLLKITQVPAAAPFVKVLDPFILPLSQTLGFIIPTPHLTIEGHAVETNEALLALTFTVGFFIFHFVAELLKVMDQRIIVDLESRKQINNLNKMRQANDRQQKTLNAQDWQVQAYIRYDFAACPSGSVIINDCARHANAHTLQDSQDVIAYRFSDIANAFSSCQSMILNLKQHYATLRPADPQPPLSIGLHASQQKALSVAPETERVANFSGRNQVIFSQTIYDLMQAQGLEKRYVFQSIGLYSLGENLQEEMFRLDPGKTTNNTI